MCSLCEPDGGWSDWYDTGHEHGYESGKLAERDEWLEKMNGIVTRLQEIRESHVWDFELEKVLVELKVFVIMKDNEK